MHGAGRVPGEEALAEVVALGPHGAVLQPALLELVRELVLVLHLALRGTHVTQAVARSRCAMLVQHEQFDLRLVYQAHGQLRAVKLLQHHAGW